MLYVVAPQDWYRWWHSLYLWMSRPDLSPSDSHHLNGQQFLLLLFVNFDEKEENFDCIASVSVMLSIGLWADCLMVDPNYRIWCNTQHSTVEIVVSAVLLLLSLSGEAEMIHLMYLSQHSHTSLEMEGENSNKEPNWSMEEIKSLDCFKCQLCTDCLGARPKTGKKKQYGGDF